ncbi:hypothetical protein PS712_05785 [Pseudomonas fluorescens]|uniref:DUF3927 domain-containing protein n=1 Tax=Pseudomonas fluorescens TaxID=294 RepID=A0A5E7FLU8_PSEFL|nr:hypothetical protein [Pseudomonas fluorescens]VVO40249.1 hypothetical protein PS712_05785 [Pseudomonas fluorescens]VVO86025.1 hypothetical protein PS854_02049 [Pseudomonas fluorescens]
MFRRFSNKARSLAAYGLAGGVVFVDSASRILSMVGDLVLVALLLMVLMVGKAKDKP